MAKTKGLVIDKNKPIVPQLKEFRPLKNVTFTGYELLTDEDDILKFFSELTAMYKEKFSEHPDPRALVHGDLQYIAELHGPEDLQWNRFHKVLNDQFEEARKNCEAAHQKI